MQIEVIVDFRAFYFGFGTFEDYQKIIVELWHYKLHKDNIRNIRDNIARYCYHHYLKKNKGI